MLGENIPVIGGLLTVAAEGVKLANNISITSRMGTLSKLIPDEKRNELATFIAKKITIALRRQLYVITEKDLNACLSDKAYAKMLEVCNMDDHVAVRKAEVIVTTVIAIILLSD